MRRRKEILRIILVVLIAVFLMVVAAAVFLALYHKNQEMEMKKQEALNAVQNVPTVAPTIAVTMTPTPSPTATPSPTPTPSPSPTPTPTRAPSFNPDYYWDYWYNTTGLASINIYNISEKSVSFVLSQTDINQAVWASADITAEITGTVAQFSFTDSLGNGASGKMIFDKNGLYLNVQTNSYASSVYPNINCMMSREKAVIATPTPIPSPTPVPQDQIQVNTQTGEYYFPDSASRYLTDEELSQYSSADLELAKNEIYARHGRQFVTDRIAEYFNSKSWYQGTVDPETFDANQDSIFNDVELANIQKIVEWENRKRSEGN